MKAAIIALAVEYRQGIPFLIEAFSDSREISILEASVLQREANPLGCVYAFRQNLVQEDDEFSDYVEDLLAKPFLKTEIQAHGLQWLKSRIRIEQFQNDETEAAKIIGNYAFEIFLKDPEMRDFSLAGPKSQVRIRVFVLDEGMARARSA